MRRGWSCADHRVRKAARNLLPEPAIWLLLFDSDKPAAAGERRAAGRHRGKKQAGGAGSRSRDGHELKGLVLSLFRRAVRIPDAFGHAAAPPAGIIDFRRLTPVSPTTATVTVLLGYVSGGCGYSRQFIADFRDGSRLCKNVFPPPKTARNRGRSAST